MRKCRSVECVCGYLRDARIMEAKGPQLILIGGCSRTGKTYLAQAISKWLGRQGKACAWVSMDAWIVSVEERKTDSTVMERYELPAIIDSVGMMMKGHTVHPPVYDPKTRKRISSKGDAQSVSMAGGVLILDGVIALASPQLRQMATVCIYTTVPDALRWDRLMNYYTRDKGIDKLDVGAILREREQEETPYVRATARYADVIADLS